jgi:hypothetical protein
MRLKKKIGVKKKPLKKSLMLIGLSFQTCDSGYKIEITPSREK